MRSYIPGWAIFGDGPGSRGCSVDRVADVIALGTVVAGPHPWTGTWVALDTPVLPVALSRRFRMR